MSKLAFTCDTKDLRSLSTQILRTVSRRGAVRVLSGVLLETTKTKLTATTTDMEMSQRMHCKVTGSPGKALVPAKQFDTILKTFDGEVTVEDQGAGFVTVTQGKTVVKVEAFVVEDFPTVPQIDRNQPAAVMMAEPFVEAYNFAATAASQDESRPVLTGILVEPDKNKVVMAATDSYRMAFTWRKAACGKDVLGDGGVIVPARALAEVARLLKDPLAFTEIRLVGDSQVGFTVGDNLEFVFRKIEGQFPNWRQLVPDTYEEVVQVDREQMRKAVDRIVKIGGSASPMRLEVHRKNGAGKTIDDTMFLSHIVRDSHELNDEIPCVGQQAKPKRGYEPLEIGINPAFVVDALAAFDTDNISVCIINPFRPSLFRADRETEGILVMPVRLA